MTFNRDGLLPKVGILLLSTVLSLLAGEWLYRVKLLTHHEQVDLTYRVTSSVPVEFDSRYGEHPKPNDESYDCFILHGKVEWGSIVGRSNCNRLSGRATLVDYEQARVRIMVFGDSFSELNLGNGTWPDLLQQRLERALNERVAVLNYARAGYGVFQMLDIAADQINELHPQLAIFAIIGDDFTRARWWAKSIDDHNVTRWMLSTRSTNFRDYHFAVDQLLVVPQATRQWCAQQLAHPNSHDPTLEKANRQFATIAREVEAVRKAVPLLSWDHSFIYYRLFKGSPYRYPPGNTPRISATDFREDPRAVADVQRIRMSGTPVILVYLPMMAELKAHKVIATPQAVVLMNSLESMLHERFYVVQQEYAGPLPTKIDLQPYDWHPNEQGLDFYAARVAHMVTRQMVKHSGGAKSY